MHDLLQEEFETQISSIRLHCIPWFHHQSFLLFCEPSSFQGVHDLSFVRFFLCQHSQETLKMVTVMGCGPILDSFYIAKNEDEIGLFRGSKSHFFGVYFPHNKQSSTSYLSTACLKTSGCLWRAWPLGSSCNAGKNLCHFFIFKNWWLWKLLLNLW